MELVGSIVIGVEAKRVVSFEEMLKGLFVRITFKNPWEWVDD